MKIGTLCYLQKENKTLLLYRESKNHAHNGKWNGLGGKLEAGETPEEGVIREVKEEAGVEIEPILVGRVIFPAFKMQPEDWHVYIFTAKDFKGKVKQSNEGKIEWIANKEISNLNMWEGDKYIFNWIMKGSFFSGKLVYNSNGNLIYQKALFYSYGKVRNSLESTKSSRKLC